MGSKGSSDPGPAPPIPQQAPDFGAVMTPMFKMMAEVMAASRAESPPPNLPPPKMQERSNIDWNAKRQELRAEVEKDMAAENRNRRGRNSTVLTSGLEDEPAKTTESVLTGG